MKIITGLFYLECNTFNPKQVGKDDFIYREGDDLFNFITVKDYFETNNCEVIPTIMASALSGSEMILKDYEYFKEKMLKTIRETEDVDAIWLHLHGAMEVEEIGSGELDLLRSIREIVGDSVVIGVVFDAHANHYIDIAKYVNVASGYRTIPHHDQPLRELDVAKAILTLINNKEDVKPSMSIIPMIVSGEKATDVQSPVKEVFAYLDELEKDERILSAAAFFGCPWADVPNGNFSVMVTPSKAEYKTFADEECVKISEYLVNESDKFEFIMDVIEPEDAVTWAIKHEESPVFITDSGDNTTGGAIGESTELLREVLKQYKNTNKKIVVSAIYDPDAVKVLEKLEEGSYVSVYVGTNRSEDEKSIKLDGVFKTQGDLYGYLNTMDDVEGKSYVVSIDNVDVVISSKPTSLISPKHFAAAGVPIEDYDICIVKQGYLFSTLLPIAKDSVMAATRGATYQHLERLDFKKVIRPIYPLDEITVEGIKYNFK